MASVVPLTPDTTGEWERPVPNSSKTRADAEAGPVIIGPVSIGLELCRARQRSGKSLTDISNQTKIAPHHLMVMERNRFDLLPGRVYAIGFVRNYAACVGLDAEPLVERLKVELRAPDAVLPVANDLPSPNREVPDTGFAGTSASEEHAAALLSPRERKWPQAATVAVLGAAALVYSVSLFLFYREQMAQPAVMSVPPNLVAEAVPANGQVHTYPSPADAQPPPVVPLGPEATALLSPPADAAAPTEIAQAESVALPQLALVERIPPVAIAPPHAASAETNADVTTEAAPAPPAIVRSKPALPIVAAAMPRFRGPLPLGRHYGSRNMDARVILRVHRPIHVAVRGPGSQIFLDRILDAGDTYRVPNMVGLKLSAPDAGAIEVILDDTTVGFARKNGIAAKDLSLDPQSIVDRENGG